ncbi:MAG: DUF445 family protein [Candidatus Syntrophonatronum acetioxidans]|uniref:DUF445 family protein n=1 Tax=Candidatus Syntrophonatronum acetioxidans TaxID=1795816 RepID=A0A424YGV8_9FIRM|nr:MAG: DUF445 family protein [Candidatus Syntrophonatronum acetioxidans]
MYLFILLPVVGAIIGWATNVIALHLLFRPRQPVVIPLTNYRIQGLIPRRRRELSRSIGKIIESELLSSKDIISQVNYEAMEQEVMSATETIIERWASKKLPVRIPSRIKILIEDFIIDLVKKEVAQHLKKVMEDMVGSAWDDVNISEIVEEKLNNLSLDRVENMVIEVASRELKHIELLGGVLGFLVGMVQAFLVFFLGS